jgi:hypothetical protein
MWGRHTAPSMAQWRFIPPEHIFEDFARTSMEAHSISGASQLKNIKFYSCSTSRHVRLQRADGANAIHMTLQSSVTDVFF